MFENFLKKTQYEIEIKNDTYEIIITSVKEKTLLNKFLNLYKKFRIIKTKINKIEETKIKKIKLPEKTHSILIKNLQKTLTQIQNEINKEKPRIDFKIYNSKIEYAVMEIDAPKKNQVKLKIKIIGDCHSS